MRTRLAVVVMLALISISAIGLCESPEQAVKSMLEAVRAGNWEKAANYIDFEGMANAMKEMMAGMMEGMDEETRAEMEKEMSAQADPEKMKEQMIEQMKEEATNFKYKIVEVKNKTEDSAVVVVKMKEEGQEEEEVPFPMKKIGGKWKVNFMDMMAMEEEVDFEEDFEEVEEK
jgi:hypothetical protein